MKISNTIGASILMLFCLFMLTSCEKDSFSSSPSGDNSFQPFDLLQWADFNRQIEATPGKLYIVSENPLNSTETSGYRIHGNFFGTESIDEITIGEVSLPVTINADGVFHTIIGVNHEPLKFERLKETLNQNIQVLYKSNGLVVDEITTNIQATLGASYYQDGNEPQHSREIDKTKTLKVTWPVNIATEPSFRDGDEIHKVGAAVVYKPLTTTRLNSDSNVEFPLREIMVSHHADYEDGEILFTQEDLAAFPYNSIVTVYVGAVRYRVNSEGELIVSNSGTNTVFSGGVQTGNLLRVNIP